MHQRDRSSPIATHAPSKPATRTPLTVRIRAPIPDQIVDLSGSGADIEPTRGLRDVSGGRRSACAFVILLAAIFVPSRDFFLLSPLLGLVDVFRWERSMLPGLTWLLGLPLRMLRHTNLQMN